ncbi:MAG: zinc ABC transporter substrate-binding protein [Myxococcales bacterium]|nr:zinc ABC transporter substrate-binding protein [Myxococcales bacterium]USN50583.1 MAG: zinc ABC transporter substrate-binding protein [Myxococcales bacterium]
MKKIISVLTCLCFVVHAGAHTGVVKTANPKSDNEKKVVVVKPKLKVVTTISALASVASAIGKDLIEINALSLASEDPHFVKAKPTFKKWVSEADVFLQVGRSLELWVPLVINSSSNKKLISGERLVSVSDGVYVLEAPKSLDRGAAGDIHPQGNPHIWLSPVAVLKVAENIKNAFSKADAQHAPQYEKNYIEFKLLLSKAMFGEELVKASGNVDFLWRLQQGNRLKAYLVKNKKQPGGWLKSAQSIDYKFLTYHSELSYLAHDFGLNIVGHVEEKSGVAPSARYQNELIKKSKENHLKHIVAATYYAGNSKLLENIAKSIGGSKIFIQVDCSKGESYIAMMDRIIQSLVKFRGAMQALPNAVHIQ